MTVWSKMSFKDLAEFNPRESIKKGEVAVKVGMDKLQPFCRDISEIEYEEFSGGTKFRNGDTIMARITPCLENGKTAMVNVLKEGQVGFGSTEYIVYRAKEGFTDPYFLYYLVCSPTVREPAIKSMVGSSGRQRVQTDVVQNLELMIPPLPEQKKIGEFLKKLDDKIAINNKINRNLHDQINALYSGQFEPYIMSENPPEGWELVKIGDIAEVKNGCAFKGADFVEDGTVPVIKIKNVKPYKILLNTVDYVKEETVIGKDRFKIRHGDILITMTGNRMNGSPDSWVGKVAVFDIFGDYYLNQRLGIIEPDTSKVSTYYLSEFLSSWMMQKYFIERATSSGGQANISPDIIKKIEFAIPPKSEMDEFEQLASNYYEAIAKLQDEMNKLEMLRDSLLPKLMSGELDVSDIDI